MKGAIRVLFVGAAAGVAAGQVMDRATTWFYERQSDASRQRENELLPEGAPMASARKLAGLIGAEPTDDQTGQLAAAMHRSLGQLYGVAAAALTRRGVPPVTAGVATGLGGFLLILLLNGAWAVVYSGFLQLIAMKTRNGAATQSGSLVFFPLLFLTPNFVPRDMLTRPMEIAASCNPVTYVMEAMRALILSTDDWGRVGLGFAVVGALCALMLALNVRAIRNYD